MSNDPRNDNPYDYELGRDAGERAGTAPPGPADIVLGFVVSDSYVQGREDAQAEQENG